MKQLLAIVLFSAASLLCPAQSKVPPVDKSPMDMSYYPVGYPVLKIQDKATEPILARVIFSRPQRNGRSIFGDLVEFGKLWRLGANEATEVEFFQTVRIGGVRVKKGRYTLYCIPYAEKWTMIINKETDTWGSFKYDESKDLTRLDVPVLKQTEPLESLAMYFEKSASGAYLVIVWDTVRVNLPITF
ncbi:MAG: DUF2911 domain-containing protein [Chitinophagaceae bacterium]|nr:DUF2911 domain-containing protein [Chitinophagaceae bacterium]